MTLRTPIKEVLEEAPIDERAVNRARSRLLGSLDRPARPRVRGWLVAAVALGVSAALFALWPRSATAPRATSTALRMAEGRVPASLRASASRRVVRFDDGSRAELEPGATLLVRRNDGSRVELVLVEGDVLFDIRPHGPRRWRIAMGRWDVEVVGTRFTLSRTPERLRVEVARGLVRVTSDEGEVRLLGASASMERSLGARSAVDAPVEPVESVIESGPPPSRPARVSPRWQERAAAGDASGAYAMLRGRFAAEVRATRDVDDLFALADVARVSGHPEDAIAPLRRIIDDLPRGPRTSVAAYTLGLLYGESLGRPADAAHELERAGALGLPRDLREPAASRRIELWTRAGRAAEARAAACEYLAAHPDGPARAQAAEACASDELH